jgi:hypothetical protein
MEKRSKYSSLFLWKKNLEPLLRGSFQNKVFIKAVIKTAFLFLV